MTLRSRFGGRLTLALVGWVCLLMCPPALAEGTFFKKKPTESATSTDAGTPQFDVASEEAALAPPASTQDTPRDAEKESHSVVSGNVDDITSTDVLIVSGQPVRLAGIKGVSGLQATNLLRWIEANGNYVTCQPMGQQYRCETSTAKDVGLAVISMGAGKAKQKAPREYIQAQAQARAAGRGIWAKR